MYNKKSKHISTNIHTSYEYTSIVKLIFMECHIKELPNRIFLPFYQSNHIIYKKIYRFMLTNKKIIAFSDEKLIFRLTYLRINK